MTLINPGASARSRPVQLGFKTSIIALFVAIVLVIGLTLVYLSFSRITAVTDSAASQFIGKVAELSADRIGSQLKLVRDNLRILNALPSVQSAQIEDNPRLNALLAAMLMNNDQLFNLYVGYDDGSFIEMDAIDGSARETRAKLEAPDQAAFRMVVISRSDPARTISRRLFLSDRLELVREMPGPLDYDPRERPWYKDADRRDGAMATPGIANSAVNGRSFMPRFATGRWRSPNASLLRFWRNTRRTESPATIAAIGPDGAGIPKGGKKNRFPLHPKTLYGAARLCHRQSLIIL
jgi:adenylate cyclase